MTNNPKIDHLLLKYRNLIADKEWITACATHDTTKYGEWQFNWTALQQAIEQDLNDLKQELKLINY